MLRSPSVVRARVDQLKPAILLAVCLGAVGCPPPKPPPAKPVYEPGKLVFAVLPAESQAYPIAARAATERLRRVRVKGLDEPQMSNVSLDVVQLQIECVEANPDCYEAVGKELAANQMLFAEIVNGPRKDSIRVTVTLFDVDLKKRRRAATKVFASEEDVVWGVADVIAEATKL